MVYKIRVVQRGNFWQAKDSLKQKCKSLLERGLKEFRVPQRDLQTSCQNAFGFWAFTCRRGCNSRIKTATVRALNSKKTSPYMNTLMWYPSSCLPDEQSGRFQSLLSTSRPRPLPSSTASDQEPVRARLSDIIVRLEPEDVLFSWIYMFKMHSIRVRNEYRAR